MKIETPACAILGLPIKQQIKQGSILSLKSWTLHHIHTENLANLCMTKKGKETWMCWHRGGVLCAQNKFEHWMRALCLGKFGVS